MAQEHCPTCHREKGSARNWQAHLLACQKKAAGPQQPAGTWACACGKLFIEGNNTNINRHRDTCVAVKSEAARLQAGQKPQRQLGLPALLAQARAKQLAAAAAAAAPAAQSPAAGPQPQEQAPDAEPPPSPSPALSVSSGNLTANDEPQPTRPCEGYTPVWPGACFALSYQFGMHGEPRLGWSAGTDGALRSACCTGVAEPSGSSCPPCLQLAANPRLQSMQRDAAADSSVNPSSGHKVMQRNMLQLQAVVQARRAQLASARFADRSVQHKLRTLQRCCSDDTRLRMLIAGNDVRRLNHVMSSSLRRGHSVSHICNQVVRAANGQYNPKAFTQKDLDAGLLLLLHVHVRWTHRKVDMHRMTFSFMHM